MTDTGMKPAAATDTMQAAVYRRFGGPEVLRVETVWRPVPRAGEVLIRVFASTVSAADHRSRSRDIPRGLKLLAAMSLGLFRPRRRVLGMDVAGVVEAVGAGVTTFAPGDEVIALLGFRFGGHAEYVVLPADGVIARKPRTMTFEEAVTLVFGGLTARSFLARTTVRPGSTVLVNGAGGAVGTAALQLAKHSGAVVTAVCSGAKAELVASLGADRVVDYAVTDFTAEARTYDVIVDCVGNASFPRVHHLLNPGGALLLVIPDLRGLLFSSRRGRKSGNVVTATGVKSTAESLRSIVELAEAGRYGAVCDRTFDLADIAAAHAHVDRGHKTGNVVVRVAAS